MKTQSNGRHHTNDMTPLLRSIAKEMVSRTVAVAELQARIRRARSDSDADQAKLAADVAALSNHRRELRMVDKELERLGWGRDREQLMTFVQEEDEAGKISSWELQETGFYRSPDLPSDD
jgi:hypothetical protein